jgi:regulatory protein
VSPNEKRYPEELARAMRSLARRQKTTAQTTAALLNRGLPDGLVDQLVSELTRQGFLHDGRYAEAYARSRLERGYGPDRIAAELTAAGAAEKLVARTISELLEESGEEQILRAALAKRLRVAGEPRTPQELKNLSDYLLRRGFKPEMVRSALESYFDKIFGEGR